MSKQVAAGKILIDGISLNVGGGVQVAIGYLAHLIAEEPFEWRAVLPHRIRAALPDAIAKDPRVHFVPGDSLLLKGRGFVVLEQEMKSFAPDAVFTIFGPSGIRQGRTNVTGFALPAMIYPDVKASILRRRYGKGLRSSYALLRERLKRGVQRYLIRQCHHLVVETEVVRQRLSDVVGIESDRIAVVPNCVNAGLGPMPPIPKRHTALSQVRVLVPSAYYDHKNLEIIPLVAAALRSTYQLDCRFEFTLEERSPEYESIANDAHRAGVGRYVVNRGRCSLQELRQAYLSADMVLLPTLLECSTAVYPEAFHFGVPLITSDRDFAHSLCGDGAVYIDPLDPNDIARAIHRLAISPDWRLALVKSGRDILQKLPSSSEKNRLLDDELRRIMR